MAGSAGEGDLMSALFMARPLFAAFVLVILAGLFIIPVSAVDKYTQGSPEFTVTVIGTNELITGQETTVTVMVKNTGLNLFKQLNQGTIPQQDLPNTAKFATIGLGSDSPDIIIKSDPLYIGDIAGNGGTATASFTVKVVADAAEKDYDLPLFISYKIPVVTTQPSSESYQYVYNTANVTLPVTIHVKQGITLRVLNVSSDNIAAGAEGIIRVQIRNDGTGSGKDAVLKVIRNAKSPVVPMDTSIYLGDLEAGEIAESRFKVAVSDDAGAQTYPIDLAIAYKDDEGADATTDDVTVGIPVLAKPEFTITPPAVKVAAGSTTTITVRYTNNGAMTVYAAQAGITDHAPITVENNVAYLGNLRPGESADAVFTVKADTAAEPGEYTFDSRVRYRDASDTSIQSDTADIVIDITPAKGGIARDPVVLGLIAAIVIAIVALLAYRYRKGMQ